MPGQCDGGIELVSLLESGFVLGVWNFAKTNSNATMTGVELRNEHSCPMMSLNIKNSFSNSILKVLVNMTHWLYNFIIIKF